MKVVDGFDFVHALIYFCPGSECKVPAGVLNLKLELYPPLTETLSPDVIATQVNHHYKYFSSFTSL